MVKLFSNAPEGSCPAGVAGDAATGGPDADLPLQVRHRDRLTDARPAGPAQVAVSLWKYRMKVPSQWLTG